MVWVVFFEVAGDRTIIYSYCHAPPSGDGRPWGRARAGSADRKSVDRYSARPARFGSEKSKGKEGNKLSRIASQSDLSARLPLSFFPDHFVLTIAKQQQLYE